MAQKLEDIRGGGGSIRVGNIGTISSLMNRELQSSTSSPSRRTPQSAPVSVSCSDTTFKLRKPINEAQSSGTRSPETIRRARGQNQHQVPVLGPTLPKRQKQKASPEEASGSRSPRSHKRTHKIPILGSENIDLDKTPTREKPARRVSIAEIVDTNCGSPAGSLSNRLKKLGFSKLSESIV